MHNGKLEPFLFLAWSEKKASTGVRRGEGSLWVCSKQSHSTFTADVSAKNDYWALIGLFTAVGLSANQMTFADCFVWIIGVELCKSCTTIVGKMVAYQPGCASQGAVL